MNKQQKGNTHCQLILYKKYNKLYNKFRVSIQKVVTNISNFAIFASDNLDKVIFLFAIGSMLKAPQNNAIRTNPPDRIHWCNYSRNILVSKPKNLEYFLQNKEKTEEWLHFTRDNRILHKPMSFSQNRNSYTHKNGVEGELHHFKTHQVYVNYQLKKMKAQYLHQQLKLQSKQNL